MVGTYCDTDGPTTSQLHVWLHFSTSFNKTWEVKLLLKRVDATLGLSYQFFTIIIVLAWTSVKLWTTSVFHPTERQWYLCGQKSPLLYPLMRNSFPCSSVTKLSLVCWKCWSGPDSSCTATHQQVPAKRLMLRSFWTFHGRDWTPGRGAMWTKTGGEFTPTAACSKRLPCVEKTHQRMRSWRLSGLVTWVYSWVQPSWTTCFRLLFGFCKVKWETLLKEKIRVNVLKQRFVDLFCPLILLLPSH